jgi:hypothetical protein
MGYEHVSNRPVCHLFWSDRSPDERTILLRIEGHFRLSPLVPCHRSFTARLLAVKEETERGSAVIIP